jgi:MFS family permease
MKAILDFIRNKESRAVGIVFMSISILFGTWVTRLPEIKEQLGFTEGQLGLALFFMPLGATLLLPFYSKILSAWGEKKATTIGFFSFMAAICLPNLATGFNTFAASLLLVGFAMGISNVAMNASAAAVEQNSKKSIMSACHGFFSLGGMIGAGTSALFISLGVSPFVHVLLWAVALCLGGFWVKNNLISGEAPTKEKKKMTLPPRSVFGLAVIGFCIMLSEGAITDWSTIYLKDSLSAPGYIASLGFAVFAGFMAAGRFFGDYFIEKLGSLKMLLFGSIMGIMGLASLQYGHYGLALLGFGATGLGFSIIVPTLFSQSARQQGVKPSVGIASVASSGYLGLLLGPVIIGFVAEHWSLDKGFMMLTALTFIALLLVLGMRKQLISR